MFQMLDGLFFQKKDITCQANETWSDNLIDNWEPCECEGTCCARGMEIIFMFLDYSCPALIPPPQGSLLVLDNTSYVYPPQINTTVTYTYHAGGPFNRLDYDFDSDNYTLTCLENNVFSSPIWPTCINSKCPRPAQSPFLTAFLFQVSKCEDPHSMPAPPDMTTDWIDGEPVLFSESVE